MESFDFRLPDIGEGVSEGEIVAWHVKEGDRVAEDQPMVEVMTDKATVAIGAPRTGVIRALHAKVGETIRVGSVLVVIDAEPSIRPSRAPKAEVPAAPSTGHAAVASAVGDIRESLPGVSLLQASVESTKNAAPAKSTATTNGGSHVAEESLYFSAKPLATPATRKLARDLNLDLRRVPPSGESGRVTKEDVMSFAQTTNCSVSTKAPRLAQTQRVPFIGIRRKIAARMQHAKNTAAHFTFVEECEATELKATRERLRGIAEAQGVKLTYLPFIVKAVVAALKKHPLLNSSLDEAQGELVMQGSYHIGIATATEQGLIVPVVKDADQRTLLELAQEIDRLATGARLGKLSPAELSGSTFTVTSLGQLGGFMATPILNMPEVGILGVHKIKERPLVKNGAVVVGEVMMLSLSFDHRIVDGHIGAAFTYDVIHYLEDPSRLLLEMI